MKNRIITFLLMPVLLVAMCPVHSASAMTKQEKRALQAEKIKEGVTDLGVGRDSVVNVKLRDHQRLTGYTSAIGEAAFVVTDRAGVTTVVPYANVAQIRGQNFSRGQKIAIGVGIAAAAIAVIAVIIYKTQCGHGKIGC